MKKVKFKSKANHKDIFEVNTVKLKDKVSAGGRNLGDASGLFIDKIIRRHCV